MQYIERLKDHIENNLKTLLRILEAEAARNYSDKADRVKARGKANSALFPRTLFKIELEQPAGFLD